MSAATHAFVGVGTSRSSQRYRRLPNLTQVDDYRNTFGSLPEQNCGENDLGLAKMQGMQPKVNQKNFQEFVKNERIMLH